MLSTVNASLGPKPVVGHARGEPPTALRWDDVVVGRGRAAALGDTVVVEYLGVIFATGEEFDATWTSGVPMDFTMGADEVIEAFEEGIRGMAFGGRRVVVIPPALGYGAEGAPPAIPADSTLVFVVDLLEVE